MKENLDHWLDSFEKNHQKYILIPTESSNYSVPEESIRIAVITSQTLINKQNNKNVISIQQSNFYTMILFLNN